MLGYLEQSDLLIYLIIFQTSAVNCVLLDIVMFHNRKNFILDALKKK